MKRVLKYFFLVFLTACSSAPDNANECPLISISRETSRSFYQDNQADKFQINLIGFEGYCYTEPSNNRRYALITPIFKVRRLESSSITSLDVDFYVKTSINAVDYLGFRKFSQTLNIPSNTKEITITGRQTKTRISMPPYDGFDIKLGLSLTDAEKQKAKKMLDVDYWYLSEEELSQTDEVLIDTIYLEIAPDEEVIYSEIDKKPVVVKKNRPKSNSCN